MLLQKNEGPKNIWVKRSLVKKIWSTRIKAPKELALKSLVEIGSVIAETYRIWTNVART